MDPYLKPYSGFFRNFLSRLASFEELLTGGRISLADFASGHEYFGLHYRDDHWTFREWAPNASAIFLVGDFTDWQVRPDYALRRIEHGNWEICLPRDWLRHGQHYRLQLYWNGGEGARLPAWGRRVVQDPHTKAFSAQIWQPEEEYRWIHTQPKNPDSTLLIYEAHVGMAQEKEGIGWYNEFREFTLPRILNAGYTAIQLMAIQEHPYYGSFGYQVANFFAPSSRFGTPEELKHLIDAAHGAGLRVFLDLVHSHAVKNEVEGLSRFDGTHYQYFHGGDRGTHPVWDSRLFDYSKPQVVHFLLSNVRYWLDEFKFDGFRFDGVTSMLFLDHGLGGGFNSYDDYFSHNLDLEALTYLALANKLAHAVRNVTTIAEDVSGMPLLAAPVDDGGAGFDYRLAMGVPDFWVRTIKTKQDEDWHVSGMFYDLTNRRPEEKTIGYAESHDQALVGDQTIIYRLLQDRMYDSMRVEQENHLVLRGTALHRLIRLMTLACAGHGYLNFMGNEWGHPEWIDFPRDGNGWSYHHARRLWSLYENPELQYHRLGAFDRAMIEMAKNEKIFQQGDPAKVYEHVSHQILGFTRGKLLFLFNFNGRQSFADLSVPVPEGHYRLILNSDELRFGGLGRVETDQEYWTASRKREGGAEFFVSVYLPTRSALVLRRSR